MHDMGGGLDLALLWRFQDMLISLGSIGMTQPP